MPTIYFKPSGEAMEVASIDAREILAASPDLYSREPPEPAAPEIEATGEDDAEALQGDADGNGYLSKAEIMADLDRLGIDYDARSSRAKLDALLREGKPHREATVNASVEG